MKDPHIACDKQYICWITAATIYILIAPKQQLTYTT